MSILRRIGFTAVLLPAVALAQLEIANPVFEALLSQTPAPQIYYFFGFETNSGAGNTIHGTFSAVGTPINYTNWTHRVQDVSLRNEGGNGGFQDTSEPAMTHVVAVGKFDVEAWANSTVVLFRLTHANGATNLDVRIPAAGGAGARSLQASVSGGGVTISTGASVLTNSGPYYWMMRWQDNADADPLTLELSTTGVFTGTGTNFASTNAIFGPPSSTVTRVGVFPSSAAGWTNNFDQGKVWLGSDAARITPATASFSGDELL